MPHIIHVPRTVAPAYLGEFYEYPLAVGVLEIGKVLAVQVRPVRVHYHLRAEVRYPEIVLVFRPVAQPAHAVGGLALGLGARQEPGFLVPVELGQQAVDGIIEFPYGLPLAVHHIALKGRDDKKKGGGYEQGDGKGAGQYYACEEAAAVRAWFNVHVSRDYNIKIKEELNGLDGKVEPAGAASTRTREVVRGQPARHADNLKTPLRGLYGKKSLSGWTGKWNPLARLPREPGKWSEVNQSAKQTI